MGARCCHLSLRLPFPNTTVPIIVFVMSLPLNRLFALPCPLQSVWASKYNARAFVSTRKVGISFDDVRMAVLCQRIVPAQVRGSNKLSKRRERVWEK